MSALTPDFKACKLLQVLLNGPMDRWSLPKLDKYRMSMTELHDTIRHLGLNGVSVSRLDAGGSPTWGITGYDSSHQGDIKRIFSHVAE